MKNHRKDAGNLNDLRALLNDQQWEDVREKKNNFKNNLERDIAASCKITVTGPHVEGKQPQ